jgi:HEAT repeat protein
MLLIYIFHMKRHSKSFGLLFLVLILGLVLSFLAFHDGDPSPVVQGKRLTNWLREYSTLKTEGADEAIRISGTNAIPVLLWMLRQKDSKIRHYYFACAAKLNLTEISPPEPGQQHYQAYRAFGHLGITARDAVPSLIEICKENISESSERWAAASLGAIGPSGEEAIPTLLAGVTNSPPKAVLVRLAYIRALIAIRGRPQTVVPVLASTIGDPDSMVRDYASVGLRVYGAEAQQAKPQLELLLTSTNAAVRRAASEAIDELTMNNTSNGTGKK